MANTADAIAQRNGGDLTAYEIALRSMGRTAPEQYSRDPASTQALRDYAGVLNKIPGARGIIGAQSFETAEAISPSRASGGGGGGSSAGNQRQAANNLGAIAGYNADSTKNQLHQANQNYDRADEQNRALADVQLKQASRGAAGDRFAQLKKLQQAASGVASGAGNALMGSGFGNLISMLRERNDLDSGELLGTLTQSQNAIRNSLDESINTNVLARNDAASAAEFALRNLEADLAAQLTNINPNLFTAPGTGAANLGSAGYAANRVTPANIAQLAGYLMPAPGTWGSRATQQPSSGSYYDRLVNGYQRR